MIWTEFTFGSKTIASTNFREFRDFWMFSGKFIPRKFVIDRFAKLYDREIFQERGAINLFDE